MCRYKKESGRSMIEMLGVLAIIGVLSVGAIAGYQKAMFKYKMNKTMDILSHAITRLAELDTTRLDTTVELDTSLLVKYGLMPDCDLDYINRNGKAGQSCTLPLGEVEINFTQSENYPMQANLNFAFLQEPFESCLAFFNSGIYKNVPEDWWHRSIDTEDEGGFITVTPAADGKSYVYAKAEVFIEGGAKSELSNTDILEACQECKDSNYCEVYWVVRGDW